jgi:hypothetical protein
LRAGEIVRLKDKRCEREGGEKNECYAMWCYVRSYTRPQL